VCVESFKFVCICLYHIYSLNMSDAKENGKGKGKAKKEPELKHDFVLKVCFFFIDYNVYFIPPFDQSFRP
jgi:ABC-type antimicrobial peptide transport system permease subunit